MPKRRGESQLVQRAKSYKVSPLKRYFRQAIPYAANFVPYGKQLYQAAKIGSSLYKGIKHFGKNSPSPKKYQQTWISSKSKDSKKWKGTSTGFYAGKFKKPKPLKKSVEALCSMKGYHHTSELWGRVEDPHCAYLIHSTYNRDRMIRVMLGALVRKLFIKAGIEINNNHSEMPLADWANSLGFRLQLVTQSPLTGVKSIQATYNTVDDQSFYTLLNALTAFTAYFQTYIDDTTDPISQPSEMLLYSLRDPGTWNLASSINLRTEMLTIFSESTLKVQNRSAPAESGATDRYELDRVDNQPLTGYIHEFSNADPRLKSLSGLVPTAVNEHLLCSNTASGLKLVRANQIAAPAALTDFSDYQEPPVAQAFKNCVKSVKVILQPGEMKKTSVYHEYKGTLITLLNKLRIQLIVSGNVSGISGKAQMVVLEEKIRTSATNPITVQYERQTKVGCIAETRKKRSLLKSEFTAGEVNEVPS